MQKLTFTLILGTLFLASAKAQVPSGNQSLDPETSKKIASKVESFVAERKVPGLTVAIGHRGKVVYSRGFGFADLEHRVPAKPETRFRTASIAKPMTAVLIMSLVQDGKIVLDQDVRKYVSAFPEKKWPVSTRQLLGHLGGVRHYQSAAEASSTRHYRSLDEALKVFAKDPLLHQPGTRFRYTTFGYNLLGNVAESAGENDFMSLLERRVLSKAEMEHTVEDNTFEIIPHRSRGYILRQNRIRNSALHDTSMKIPGGGLRSTSEDLARFVMALHAGKLISPSLVKLMWTEQETQSGGKTGYGLGWRVGGQNGRTVVGHTGGQSGTTTVLQFFPKSEVAIAIMCNLQNTGLSNLAGSIAGEVIEQIEKGPSKTSLSDAIEKLDNAIQYEVERKDLPAFSISVVDGNRVAWSKGYGYQDKDQTIPATADTVYRVGSISKLLTDISVLQLVESGELDLDTPVKEYLPNFKPANTSGIPITLRHLMTHRSGLVRESPVGNYFDPTEPDLQATVESLNGTPLSYPPGSKTKYSNAAIAVVGAILESKLKGQHADLVQEKLIEPLGMKRSSFTLTEEIREHLADGFMWTYDGRRFEAPGFALGTGPAGNLYSSVHDLTKFILLIFDQGRSSGETIVKPETLKVMMSPSKNSDGSTSPFGIGFHLLNWNGESVVGHGGAVYGYSAQLEAIPRRKLGVVSVASLDGSNGIIQRLNFYALRLMIALQDGNPLPEYLHSTDISPQRARQLVGTYQQRGGIQKLSITENDGKVSIEYGDYLHQLKAKEKDGSVIIDDVFAYGLPVVPMKSNRLRIGRAVYQRVTPQPPAPVEEDWKGLIGEYGHDHNVLYILERHGKLYALIEWFYYYPLTQINKNEFRFPDSGLYHGESLYFERDEQGQATEVIAAQVRFKRREVGTRDGATFKIQPVRPIAELRKSALDAKPPRETGSFLDADLIELTSLDPTILLDIRYATTNNFTGSVFYKQAKALMQRPAAKAVARANARLKPRGLGLLVHDAYRPWHVTKMFWDATPTKMKNFVANPANGSRHNRGCAVDLTLYDLKTGRPIQMVAGYDEFSPRAFPMYPGGTSRQRWYRDLLRHTMEAEGFQVYEYEWWHFDYKDWKKYRIGNQTFEELVEGK